MFEQISKTIIRLKFYIPINEWWEFKSNNNDYHSTYKIFTNCKKYKKKSRLNGHKF